MDIVYLDSDIIVAVKPPRVLSTDEPGGMPELLREHLGNVHANIRTVHRLDRVVSGLMVFARSSKNASELSRQIREDEFAKDYVALVHGKTPRSGEMRDLLLRNKAERKTYVTDTPGKEAQEAALTYETLRQTEEKSMVRIHLVTGRTHQIRCQFSSRGFPLFGDRKYSTLEDDCEICLWSQHLHFSHPKTGESMDFSLPAPWEETF